MLNIVIPANELWDLDKEEFVFIKETHLTLEHSLISVSKWETKWEKPFIGKGPETDIEMLDYIKCMTTNKNIDPVIYMGLTEENISDISSYINKPMTATWFKEKPNGRGGFNRALTSEVIYYYMTALNIPFECEKWPLNRLITLIRVCNEENNASSKKMSKNDILKNNAAINAQRRKRLNTKG